MAAGSCSNRVCFKTGPPSHRRTVKCPHRSSPNEVTRIGCNNAGKWTSFHSYSCMHMPPHMPSVDSHMTSTISNPKSVDVCWVWCMACLSQSSSTLKHPHDVPCRFAMRVIHTYQEPRPLAAHCQLHWMWHSLPPVLAAPMSPELQQYIASKWSSTHLSTHALTPHSMQCPD